MTIKQIEVNDELHKKAIDLLMKKAIKGSIGEKPQFTVQMAEFFLLLTMEYRNRAIRLNEYIEVINEYERYLKGISEHEDNMGNDLRAKSALLFREKKESERKSVEIR